MIAWLQSITASIERIFGSRQKDLDRSRLVGMYLDQTNQPAGAGTRARSCREREDGKFAQARQRG
jgi:hypothetical protein